MLGVMYFWAPPNRLSHFERATMDINCLQPVNYDALNLNRKLKKKNKAHAPYNPASLEELCCRRICRAGSAACERAITTCPVHLAPGLLRLAFDLAEGSAIVAFIGNWPLDTLCFRQILSEKRKCVLEEEMFLDLLIFKGVSARTRKCRLKTLDFRGIELNTTFVKLIVNMWPVLSLKKYKRNTKHLTKVVLKQADLKVDNRLAEEIIPKILHDMISHERSLQIYAKYAINIPKGQKLSVLLDKVEFSTQSTFFMDYLIIHCLKEITPLVVEASNISVRSELNTDDEILDSLAPFIAFRGHDTQTLRGIWLANLEESVLYVVQKDLSPFTHLTALGLPNCNLALREGRTRGRTRTRTQFTQLLAGFPHLVKLDLTQNSFSGCLREILDALHLPLEYLNLKDCDLVNEDMLSLAQSRHAKSLKYLNVSRICGLFPDDELAVSTMCLISSLKHFSNVRVLHMQQNQIGDERCDELCDTLINHCPRLKALNLQDNTLNAASCTALIRACALAPSVQCVRTPHMHNLVVIAEALVAQREFKRSLYEVAKAAGKPGLKIQPVSMGFTLLGHY